MFLITKCSNINLTFSNCEYVLHNSPSDSGILKNIALNPSDKQMLQKFKNVCIRVLHAQDNIYGFWYVFSLFCKEADWQCCMVLESNVK